MAKDRSHEHDVTGACTPQLKLSQLSICTNAVMLPSTHVAIPMLPYTHVAIPMLPYTHVAIPILPFTIGKWFQKVPSKLTMGISIYGNVGI